jgi:branched-subunit amino acid transport protein
VFLLGLAYGFLNEGLLAQTLIRFEHVPISNFDHYVYVGGVNLSRAALIVPWHALMAVLFPLTLLDFWFPSCARVRCLSQGPFAALTALLAATVTFIALARKPHTQMPDFLLAIMALVVCAWLARNQRPTESRR